jgi:secreted trypsin-like serine protease
MHRLILWGARVALVVGVLVSAAWVSEAARPVRARDDPLRVGYDRANAAGMRAPRARASIVGGRGASIASFPFQVALYDPRAGSPAAGFFCGGVIIDATHVATAAHCVVGSGSSGSLEVLAGSTSLSRPDAGSVRDPVASSSFDSRYEPASSDYDVALLTLARPLWSSQAPPAVNGVSTIAPLPVDAGRALAYGNPNITPAVIATASGWGDVNPAPGSGPGYPTSLRAVRMPLVSDGLCEEAYAAIEQTITPRMICAGGGRSRVDTCYGDSGGPLLADQNNPPRPPGDYVLVGLVDFGNGCAQRGYPGVYASIADPDVARFLQLGAGHRATPIGKQAKKKRKKRHRHRHR